jgi:hypothetical protein
VDITTKLKRTLAIPVNPTQNLHKKEKPLRGNALSFALKSFIK